MKKLLSFFALTFILNCTSSVPKTKTPPTQTQTEVSIVKEVALETSVMEMTIEGMVCAMGCAAVIEKTLTKQLVSPKQRLTLQVKKQ